MHCLQLFCIVLLLVGVVAFTCPGTYLSLMLGAGKQSHVTAMPLQQNTLVPPWVSSVWCQRSSTSGLQCKFENICYDNLSNSFLFISGPSSIIDGIDSFQVLNEELFLSSVQGHNAYLASIAEIPFLNFDYDYVNFSNFKILFMSRFKPDNIYHAFHDDLLPIYFTMRQICGVSKSCYSSWKLVFLDNYSSSLFLDLYELFLKSIRNVSRSHLINCFHTSFVGLNKMSVWYQYGFRGIQGSMSPQHFNGYLLKEFVGFVQNKLHIGVNHTNSKCCVVLLSRKSTRKILNEAEVMAKINGYLKNHKNANDSCIESISLEEQSSSHIIHTVANAKVLVGMHGSGLIYGIFLPSGSILLELWPFGISPAAAPVFRIMSELKGSGFEYLSWENKLVHNSVLHPEYPTHYGGLGSMEPTEQETFISNSFKEPLTAVHCCDSPVWLIKIYQDTFVSFEDESFASCLLSAVKKSEEGSAWSGVVHPGRPVVVQCKLTWDGKEKDATVELRWLRDRWGCNIYEVITQIGDGSIPITAIVSDSTTYSTKFVTNSPEIIPKVSVWLSIICGERTGPATFISCS